MEGKKLVAIISDAASTGQFIVSPAKHSGAYGSLCPMSVCPSIRLCVCPLVTLSW